MIESSLRVLFISEFNVSINPEAPWVSLMSVRACVSAVASKSGAKCEFDGCLKARRSIFSTTVKV